MNSIIKVAVIDRFHCMMIERKTLSDGHDKSFIVCLGTYIEIEIDFHQLGRKMDALGGWFNRVDW